MSDGKHVLHEQLLANAELYALGSLDAGELSAFEAHLAQGCDQCDRAVAEATELLCAVGGSLPPVSPPPQVKQRLVAEISRSSAARETSAVAQRDGGLAADGQGWGAPRPRRAWLGWAFAFSAAAAVFLLIVVLFLMQRAKTQRGDFDRQLALVSAELSQQQDLAGELRGQLDRLSGRNDRLRRMLAAARVQLVRLQGLKPSPNARARLLYDAETREGVLVAHGLAGLSRERVYELWAIAAGKAPVPAGTFRVGDDGLTLHDLPPLPTDAFTTFAVTDEPQGGTSKPTGKMHLLGKLESI